MNLAISCWDGRIAPVFDVTRELIVLRIEGDGAVDRRTLELPDEPLAERLNRLVDAGVDELICGAVSREVEGRLQARGIRVLAFRAGDVEEILRARFEGRLEDDDYAMPGCCGRRRRHRRGGGRGGGEGRGRGCRGRGPRCGR